jgi:hypothetical protein
VTAICALLRIPRVVKVIFQLEWININAFAFLINLIHGKAAAAAAGSNVFAF